MVFYLNDLWFFLAVSAILHGSWSIYCQFKVIYLLCASLWGFWRSCGRLRGYSSNPRAVLWSGSLRIKNVNFQKFSVTICNLKCRHLYTELLSWHKYPQLSIHNVQLFWPVKLLTFPIIFCSLCLFETSQPRQIIISNLYHQKHVTFETYIEYRNLETHCWNTLSNGIGYSWTKAFKLFFLGFNFWTAFNTYKKCYWP